MVYSGEEFLKSVLGEDGYIAIKKSCEYAPEIASLILPQAVMSWVATVKGFGYDAAIPGTVIAFKLQKSESYIGSITTEAPFYFEEDTVELAAAKILSLMKYEPVDLDSIKTNNLGRFFKTIEMLVHFCVAKQGKEKLKGGLGDGKDIKDFDPKQVEEGLKVEMEHTKDPKVAEEIVKDHLSESPTYYSKLKQAGL